LKYEATGNRIDGFFYVFIKTTVLYFSPWYDVCVSLGLRVRNTLSLEIFEFEDFTLREIYLDEITKKYLIFLLNLVTGHLDD